MAVKTTIISVETETLLIIRRAKAVLAWCPDCHAEVDVITLDNDSLAEPVTVAQIQQWLGTGKLHFWRTADGPARICMISLLQCFESEEVQRVCSSNLKPLDLLRRKHK